MRRFMASDATSAQWLRRHISTARQFDLFANMVFAVEGGLLTSRADWPTAAKLRKLAELESQGPDCLDASEILELVRRDLPLLNRERANVL